MKIALRIFPSFFVNVYQTGPEGMKTCDILGDHTGASASEIEISTEKNPRNGSDIPKTAITIGIITIKKQHPFL
jgi:hypothetical protein